MLRSGLLAPNALAAAADGIGTAKGRARHFQRSSVKREEAKVDIRAAEEGREERAAQLSGLFSF
jgi:hypothetical protein